MATSPGRHWCGLQPRLLDCDGSVVEGYSVGKAVEVWGVPRKRFTVETYAGLVRNQLMMRQVKAAREVRDLLQANPGVKLRSDRDRLGKRRWFLVGTCSKASLTRDKLQNLTTNFDHKPEKRVKIEHSAHG